MTLCNNFPVYAKINLCILLVIKQDQVQILIVYLTLSKDTILTIDLAVLVLLDIGFNLGLRRNEQYIVKVRKMEQTTSRTWRISKDSASHQDFGRIKFV